MSLISVIVPVYKVEQFLSRCVNSILSQTFSDFELILVDDGSPDNCGTICDEYAAQDSRVHVIHQANGGLSAARNAGIDWAFAHSDSQWLTFIDSDDWIHPRFLETLLRAAQETNCSVSVCGYVETAGEPASELLDDDLHYVLWTPEDFWCAHNVNATVAWGKLYRRECFSSLRYPVGRIHEDEFTTYRVLFAQSQLAIIQAPLYRYYINPDGITKKTWSPSRLDILDALSEQIVFFQKGNYSRAYQQSLFSYLHRILSFISVIEKTNRLGKPYLSRLRRRLRAFLLHNRKVFPFRKYKHYYEDAFPRTMWLYWSINAQLRKLFHRSSK